MKALQTKLLLRRGDGRWWVQGGTCSAGREGGDVGLWGGGGAEEVHEMHVRGGQSKAGAQCLGPEGPRQPALTPSRQSYSSSCPSVKPTK